MTTTVELVRIKMHPLARPRPSGHTGPGGIHLSEVGGCPRKQTLRILGYAPAPESDQQRSIFNAGIVWEEWIGKLWAEKYPRQVRRQIAVPTEFGTGYIDLWIAPEQRIIEIKTTKAFKWSLLPMPEHVAQVQMYLHFWGNERDATAEIAYVLKESGEVLSIPVVYDAALCARLVDVLVAIRDAVEARTPLPVPTHYVANKFPCSWNGGSCQFYQHCWGDGQA